MKNTFASTKSTTRKPTSTGSKINDHETTSTDDASSQHDDNKSTSTSCENETSSTDHHASSQDDDTALEWKESEQQGLAETIAFEKHEYLYGRHMNFIGCGSGTKVYDGYCPAKKQQVKVKEYPRGCDEEGISAAADLCKELNHENIMKVYDYKCEFFRCHVVMENAGVENLHFYLFDETENLRRDRAFLSAPEVRGIMRQVFFGLSELHAKGYRHEDLRLPNIMLKENSLPTKVTLVDFDTATQSDLFYLPATTDDTMFWRSRYLAPEMFDKENNTDVHVKLPNVLAPDMWSCGIIMFVLFTGRFPFDVDAVVQETSHADETEEDHNAFLSVKKNNSSSSHDVDILKTKKTSLTSTIADDDASLYSEVDFSQSSRRWFSAQSTESVSEASSSGSRQSARYGSRSTSISTSSAEDEDQDDEEPEKLDRRSQQLVNKIRSGFFAFPDEFEVPAGAQSLIRALLEVNPAARLSVQEALEHPWMQVR